MMVIGADTLSRISDPHDRDSLIYADGAGAVIVEGRDTESRASSRAPYAPTRSTTRTCCSWGRPITRRRSSSRCS